MSAKEEAGTIAKGKYQKWLEPDGLILLQGWARDGLTDEQLAHNIGISVSTLDAWKNRFPEISAALKKGKAVVDFAVENAFLKRAMSGDTTAQIFWLKNRRPDQWRDKPAPPDADTDLLKTAKELLGVSRVPLTEKQLAFATGCNRRWNIKTGATGSGKSWIDYTLIIPQRIIACRGEGA